MLTVGHDLMMKREEDVGANHPPITSIMNCSDSLPTAVYLAFLRNLCSQQTGIPQCSSFHGKMDYDHCSCQFCDSFSFP